MALNLAPCPASIKSIQHYLKTASDHEQRDPVIAYWCRLAALQLGMSLDKSSKESLAVLLPLMDWLEATKKNMVSNEAITSEIVASAHVENQAYKLFLWADTEDRAARFNKNVVKAFYTSGMLFDVLSTFGELRTEVQHHRKYAKWKAAYIHKCLKNGETPTPGPMSTGEDEDDIQFPPIPGSSDDQGYPAPGPGYGAPYSGPPAVSPGHPPPAFGVPVYPPGASGANYFPPSDQHYQQFQPQQIQPAAPVSNPINNFNNLNIQPPAGSSGVKLSIEQTTKAQKYCKYAVSALDYEDLETAILNLNKALHLCSTGQELQ